MATFTWTATFEYMGEHWSVAIYGREHQPAEYEFLNIVRKCKTMDEVFEKVQDRFGLSELQTKTILDIPLNLLSQLDVSQLEALKVDMDN